MFLKDNNVYLVKLNYQFLKKMLQFINNNLDFNFL